MLVPVVLALGSCGDDGDRAADESGTLQPTSLPSSSVPPLPVTGRTDKSVAAAPPGVPVVELVCCEYSPADLSVRGTSISLFLVNVQTEADLNQVVKAADLQHDLTIVGADGISLAQSDRLALGERATFTVDGLPPGSYEFYCTLPGHSAQGMRGKLRIEA